MLKRFLTLAELFVFASAAETVVLAFLFAWIALHEASLLEHWAEFWEFGNECARDGELDSVNLTGETTTFYQDSDIEFFFPNSFERGQFNILEPIGRKASKDEIDLIIVPLLFFDKYNNRMGYGRGYYDRYLKDYKGITVGVGYYFQEVEEIDTKPTDVKLNYIIKGVI